MKTKRSIGICDCHNDILKDAKHARRATWLCPNCGCDISLAFVLTHEATASSGITVDLSPEHQLVGI